jgi:hypothetical protein
MTYRAGHGQGPGKRFRPSLNWPTRRGRPPWRRLSRPTNRPQGEDLIAVAGACAVLALIAGLIVFWPTAGGRGGIR